MVDGDAVVLVGGGGGGFGLGVWGFLGFEWSDGEWLWGGFEGEGEGCNGVEEMTMLGKMTKWSRV